MKFTIIAIIILFVMQSVYSQDISLPEPKTSGGMPLLDALSRRHSEREFSDKKLSHQQLSDLLWAGWGINRKDSGKRTAPSSRNFQEIDVYVCLPEGSYIYDAKSNILKFISSEDSRKLTGTQDFVSVAYLNLVYVADYNRIPQEIKDYQYKASYANAGFIVENIYLWCASEGLSSVVRASFNEQELSHSLKLSKGQKIILAQTIGYSK